MLVTRAALDGGWGGRRRKGGLRGSHLRDVGRIAKSYQVAEERSSITEHQIQSHQPNDTWRHEDEERSGSCGTRSAKPDSPRPHRKAWPGTGDLEKQTALRWGPRLCGLCSESGDNQAAPTFEPFLVLSLHRAPPPYRAVAQGTRLHRGSGEAPTPSPARGPSPPGDTLLCTELHGQC